MKNIEKIVGIWDGGVFKNSSYLETCSEYELYAAIEYFSGHFEWTTPNSVLLSAIKDNMDEMNPYDYALAKCKLQTQRFGVPVKDGQVDKDSYWAWYSWWKEYIAKMCYPINFGHLKEMTRERKFDQIHPEGDWSNNVK